MHQLQSLHTPGRTATRQSLTRSERLARLAAGSSRPLLPGHHAQPTKEFGLGAAAGLLAAQAVYAHPAPTYSLAGLFDSDVTGGKVGR